MPLTEAAVYNRLRELVAERLQLKPEVLAQISLDLPVVEGLELDSLAQVTLLAAVEDEFDVVLEMEDREKIVTVRDLAKLIADRAATQN